MNLDKITNLSFVYFMPLLMINYYLNMRGFHFTKFILDPLIVFLTLKALSLAIKSKYTGVMKAMNFFLWYTIATVLLYIINDAPIDCYFGNLRLFVFPILFSFLGYSYSSDNKYNNMYLYSCLVCFIVGFYLYFAGPSYYREFMLAQKDVWYSQGVVENEMNILDASRFSSFFGSSYYISYFSVPALILSLSSINYTKEFKRKIFLCLTAIVSFIAALLCQQRVAMFSAIAVLLFFIFNYSRKGKSLYVILGVIVVSLLVCFFGDFIGGLERFDSVFFLVSERFEKMQFSTAMDARSGQFTEFDRCTIWSFLPGLGLGSCGNLVGPLGLKAIYDAEFFKIFYELGLLGFITFIYIVISTIKRALHYFNYLHAEFLIVSFFLLACIGANALSYFFSSAFFWYNIGRIWNNDYLNYKIKTLYGN